MNTRENGRKQQMEITWLLPPILLLNGPRTEELKRRPGSFKNVILRGAIESVSYWTELRDRYLYYSATLVSP
jgi:hypothetical protein